MCCENSSREMLANAFVPRGIRPERARQFRPDRFRMQWGRVAKLVSRSEKAGLSESSSGVAETLGFAAGLRDAILLPPGETRPQRPPSIHRVVRPGTPATPHSREIPCTAKAASHNDWANRRVKSGKP